MATGKKFYGIKLRTSFLDSEKIDFLLSQKNGANYVDVENKNIRTAFTRKEFDKSYDSMGRQALYIEISNIYEPKNTSDEYSVFK